MAILGPENIIVYNTLSWPLWSQKADGGEGSFMTFNLDKVRFERVAQKM